MWTSNVIITQNDFARFTKRFKSDEAPWNSVINFSEDKYIDGYEVIGDITRKREKSKEPTDPFVPTDSKDT